MVKLAEGALLQSIQIDRGQSKSLASQVCTALRQLILSGALPAGARLPATRTLATELDLARATVVEVYERLVVEELLETRVGDGTYVSQALKRERPAAVACDRGKVRRIARLSKPMIEASAQFAARLKHNQQPFTTALPAFEEFPMAQWARLSSKHWRQPRDAVLGYAVAHGLPALRRAIAAHLRANRGIDCDWRHIFITAGAQHAFQLIGAMLVDAGDKVWFENPGAIGARNSLLLGGADLVPVPVDEDGLDVGAGLRRAPRFKLAFVTPSHQQPLGAKMSLERRFALLRAAEDCEGWIIEDDWDGEFCLSGLPLPTLKGIDSGDRVIYVGTFSKTLFPALRLGFVLAPEALSEALHASIEAFSPGVPTGPQAVVADFIAEGHFATHIRRMRRLYAERHDMLIQSASRMLSGSFEVVPTTTGMHTIAFLKRSLRAEAVSRLAASKGITLTPVDRFCIAPYQRQAVVLGFSAFHPQRIEAAVATIAQLLEPRQPVRSNSRSAS